MEPTTESLLRDNAELYRRVLLLQLFFVTESFLRMMDGIRDRIDEKSWYELLNSGKAVLRRVHQISKNGDFDGCRIASIQADNVLSHTDDLVAFVNGQSTNASYDPFFYAGYMDGLLLNMQDL